MSFIVGSSGSRRSPATLGSGPAARTSIAWRFSRLLGEVRGRVVASVHRIRSVSPDRWFLVVFVLLVLAFVLVFLVQPSSVGRGGR
jgi:hypothetical protein